MPDKVYLLFDGYHEDRYVRGVYASLEAAQSEHPTSHEAEWEAGEPGYWSCAFRYVPIEESIPDMTFETAQVPVIDGTATLPDGRVLTVDPPAKWVVYPIMPKLPPPYVGDTYCSLDIEEREVL